MPLTSHLDTDTCSVAPTKRVSPSLPDVLPNIPVNSVLVLAGTLHGIHALTARLSPAPPPGAPPAGMESFEAEGWGGNVFLTPTGE
jgi:hypothetical protein